MFAFAAFNYLQGERSLGRDWPRALLLQTSLLHTPYKPLHGVDWCGLRCTRWRRDYICSSRQGLI